MASFENSLNTCRDCVALMAGKLQDPHRYLMASARSAQSLGYRCLICDSNLTCELGEWAPRWQIAGGGESSIHAEMKKGPIAGAL